MVGARTVRWGLAALALVGGTLVAGGPASADTGTGTGTAPGSVPPQIVSVTASPAGPTSDEVVLPAGAATEHFAAQVTGASRVVFILDKAGKGLVTIGDDSTPADGFTADYSVNPYLIRGVPWLCSQLILEVTGPGGQVRQVVMDVYNDRPIGF